MMPRDYDGTYERDPETMARRDDPASSKAAARKIAAQTDRRAVEVACSDRPMRTAVELDEANGWREKCRKRLPELREAGLVVSLGRGTEPMRWVTIYAYREPWMRRYLREGWRPVKSPHVFGIHVDLEKEPFTLTP